MLGVALISQLPTTNLASMLVGNCEAPHYAARNNRTASSHSNR